MRKGYAKYRTVASELTARGIKMNHSAVHSRVLKAMRFVAGEAARAVGANLTDAQLDAVSRSSRFQEAVAEIMVERSTGRIG